MNKIITILFFMVVVSSGCIDDIFNSYEYKAAMVYNCETNYTVASCYIKSDGECSLYMDTIPNSFARAYGGCKLKPKRSDYCLTEYFVHGDEIYYIDYVSGTEMILCVTEMCNKLKEV